MADHANAPTAARPPETRILRVLIAQFVLTVAFWALVLAGVIDHHRLWTWWRIALAVVGLKLAIFGVYRLLDTQRSPRKRFWGVLRLALAAGLVVLALRGL